MLTRDTNFLLIDDSLAEKIKEDCRKHIEEYEEELTKVLGKNDITFVIIH